MQQFITVRQYHYLISDRKLLNSYVRMLDLPVLSFAEFQGS